MSLETGTRIQDLVETNPVGATDFVSQGDDQIRLIKTCVKGSLPNLGSGQVTASAEELSILDGATLSTAELNVLDGATLSTAELNILDGATLSTAELNILDGATLSTAELNILDGVTLTAAQINDAARKSAANTFSDLNTFSLKVTFSATLEAADGAVSLPAYSFGSDNNSGLYLGSPDNVRMAAGGNNVCGFAYSGGAILQPFGIVAAVSDGSAAAPIYSWNSDSNSGIYRVGADNYRAAAGGNDVCGFAYSGGAILQPFGIVAAVSDGSAAAPIYSWNSDSDLGFYRIGANNCGVSAGNALAMDWLPVASGAARVADYGGTLQAVGFRSVPQNSQSSNYTAVLADSGKHILHPNGGGSGDTFTIPANASVAYEIGTVLTFVNRDSNSVSIAITSDTLVFAGSTTTGTRTLAQNGIATAIKVESTTWIISGTGLS